MRIGTTNEIWALCRQRRLRIPEIGQAAAALAPEIEQQRERQGLQAGGPWHFVSRGLPKDGETLFDWSICRPVIRAGQENGAAGLCHLPAVPVASVIHAGPLATLFGEGYAPLLAAIRESGRTLTGESREVYHDWTGTGEDRQTIEIQFCLAD